jgi:hypothetical protein
MRMRMTAPAIGGAAVLFAVVLVWLVRPEPPVASVPPQVELAATLAAGSNAAETAVAPPVPNGPAAEATASSPPVPERSPLPGETPATPMADVVTERQNMIRRAGAGGPGNEFPPQIAAVELEFGTEPVDRDWAPGAEAAVFAAFAQIPGLQLIDQQVECRSTMCRIQLTQPGSAVTSGERPPFNILSDSIGLRPRFVMMVGAGTTAQRSIGYFWREGFAPSEEPDQPQRNN